MFAKSSVLTAGTETIGRDSHPSTATGLVTTRSETFDQVQTTIKQGQTERTYYLWPPPTRIPFGPPFFPHSAGEFTMPPFPAYPVVCGLSTCLVLLPLPWHWKARNTGTLLYIGWTVLGNLVFLVNTIVWHGQIRYDPAPVWCDICEFIVCRISF